MIRHTYCNIMFLPTEYNITKTAKHIIENPCELLLLLYKYYTNPSLKTNFKIINY